MSTHAVYYYTTIVWGETVEVITVTPVICYLINYSIKIASSIAVLNDKMLPAIHNKELSTTDFFVSKVLQFC